MATIDGTSGNDTLTGTEFGDRIRGYDAEDVLHGLDGDDTLDGGSGYDTLYGGMGDDLYLLYAGSGTDAIYDEGGMDTVISDPANIHLQPGIERLLLESGGTGRGNELDNVMVATHGTAWLDGGDGHDTLLGGYRNDNFVFDGGSGDYGNDVVDGGAGHDQIAIGKWSAVVVDFRSQLATGGGVDGSGTVAFTDIEAVGGGSFDDTLIAGEHRVSLYGGGGGDTLIGGAGNDKLWGDVASIHFSYGGTSPGDDLIKGGAGKDVIMGESGKDRIYGDSGNDVLYFDAVDILVSGGSGEADVLRTAGANLDLIHYANDILKDIEVIDLTDGWNANKLRLNKADILDISSTTNTLKVLGGAGDAVDIVGRFEHEGRQGKFQVYQVGAATLLVDTDIDVG